MTAARRSATLPEEGIASRIRKVTRVSFMALSALMIPIAMQAPAVSPIMTTLLTTRPSRFIGQRQLLSPLYRIF